MKRTFLWFACSWVLLSACGAKHAKSEGYASPDGYGGGGYYSDDESRYDLPAAPPPASPSGKFDAEEQLRESASGSPRRSERAPAKAPPAQPTPALPSEPAPAPAPAPAQASEAPTPARMVHYDGWMQLRVANPRETLDEAVQKAESFGGRTERMAGNTVTVRVPVARFEEAWAALLSLGDTMNKTIRADDVTESFTALDLRANTLRATQKRLIALLAKAKDEQEKLTLLAELTRVSTELDALESQLRTLQDLAAMSRITLEAYPREAFQAQGGRPALDGFSWIASLSPFNRSVREDDHRVALPVPEGLVGLSTKGPFVAESADGTVFWTMRLQNDPVGSAPFWLSAVQDRLASEFVSPEPSRVRSWECLSLLEPGADEPYRWQICVKTEGNKLQVAQVFYPSQAQFERYGAAIESSLSAGGES